MAEEGATAAALLRRGPALAGSSRRIRSHWPATRLTIPGDGHYSRPGVMAWCEVNNVLGLPGNIVLSRRVEAAADDVRVHRAEAVSVPITAAPASSLSATIRHVRRLAHAPQHDLGAGYVPVWFWAVWDRA